MFEFGYFIATLLSLVMFYLAFFLVLKQKTHLIEKILVLFMTSFVISSLWFLINRFYNHGLTFAIFVNVSTAICLIIYAYLKTKKYVLSF